MGLGDDVENIIIILVVVVDVFPPPQHPLPLMKMVETSDLLYRQAEEAPFRDEYHDG